MPNKPRIPTNYKGELQKQARRETIQFIVENLRPGDRFYSERDLAEYLGIARTTAAKIIQEFVYRGILVRMSKGRAFVARMPNEIGPHYLLMLPFSEPGKGGKHHNLHREQTLQGFFTYLQDFDASAKIINVEGAAESEVLERVNSQITNVDICVIFDYPKRRDLVGALLGTPAMAGKGILTLNGTEPRTAYIVPDEEKAIGEAVHYLHSMGHRQLLYFDGVMQTENRHARARRRGFDAAAKRLNLADSQRSRIHPPADRVDRSDPVDSHRRFFKAWLDDHPKTKFTGVVCSGDVGAAGVVKALRDTGLRVPEDVSVFGYGNLSSDRYHEFFELSSVGVSHQDFGQRAGKLLCEYVTFLREAPENPSPTPFQRKLNTELFIRGTTGKAPAKTARLASGKRS